ncbi:hypothetical protein GC177_06100 [bacterium]|nr:hypothetical protein [bacterium]
MDKVFKKLKQKTDDVKVLFRKFSHIGQFVQHLSWASSDIARFTYAVREDAAARYEDELLERELAKHGDKTINRYNCHVFSQNFEDAIISEIYSRIGEKERSFVEIGAGNGLENNTRYLLTLGWSGLWVEGSEANVEFIRKRFAREIEEGRLKVVQSFITKENIQEILDANGYGEYVDYFNIDINQNTSHVWRAVKTRCRVACIEYNANFHPSVSYEVEYDPNKIWDKTALYGGSLKSMELIGREKGLSLVGCDLRGINAFFVKNDEAKGRFVEPFDAETHYQPTRYTLARVRGNTREKAPWLPV